MFNFRPSHLLRGKRDYDPAKHLKIVQHLHAKYPLNNKASCDEWTIKTTGHICENAPKFWVKPVVAAVHQIFGDSLYVLTPPTLQERQYLTDMQAALSEDHITAATSLTVGIFKAIISHIPVPEGTGPTVPLHTICKTYRELVHELVQEVCTSKYGSSETFPRLCRRFTENIFSISGVDIEKDSENKKLVSTLDYDGDPGDYLHATPFAPFFHTPVPFVIPRDRWPTHAIILAPSEWGKSELTGLYLREAIEDPEPRAIFLLDPHGDLMKKAIPRIPPERLVVIDPDTSPPDLNILDYGVLSEDAALETFKFLMSSLAGGLSPKQETCIDPLFALLKNIPDANLITLHDIITEQAKKPTLFAEPVSRLEDIHRKFFVNLWYSGSFGETRDALQWKLSRALAKPAFRQMFSAKKNSIDMWRFVEERKVVLVKGGEAALGKEGMRLFLLFLVGQYYAVGKRRDAIPETQRHLTMMFVDEASHVLQSPMISDILVELRKYRCSFIAASQLWEHIGNEVRPAVLGSTGIKIVGELGHAEATALAADMHTSVEAIKSLKAVPRSHAEWCYFIRSVTDRAVRVTVPYGELERMPVIEPHSGPFPFPTNLPKLTMLDLRTHEGSSKPEPSSGDISMKSVTSSITKSSAEADPPIIPEPGGDDFHTRPMRKA